MYRVKLELSLLVALVFPAGAAVVSDVRYKLSAGDLYSAEALAEDYRSASGANSEYAAALAWLARGAWMMGKTDAARQYLSETKTLTSELLKRGRVEDDAYLEAAIGTSIEVEAQIMATAGKGDQAVAFLEAQLPQWKTWRIQSRIHKNIDLLTMVGKPAPELDAQYRGSPILLFLWAHWCGDCKAQGPTIAKLKEKYEPRGLRVIAPTRRYGEVPKVEKPTPEQEDQEIDRVWKTSYAGLAGAPHPVSEAMMLRYGVSATPTLVLIDRQGIVRMYSPTRMTEAELSRRIETLLAETPAALH